MLLFIMLGCFNVVWTQPCVLCPPPEPPPSTNHGSIILHYTDGTKHKINDTSFDQDCRVTKLKRKKMIAKVEVASGDFLLSKLRNGRGGSFTAVSVGHREFSAEEMKLKKVGRVVNRNCSISRKANVPMVAILVCVGAVTLVLAGFFIHKRRRYQQVDQPDIGI